MEPEGSLAYDVLDFEGAGPKADLAGNAAKHALVFSRAWYELYGVVPSGAVHSRYCGGVLPSQPTLNPIKFMQFLSEVARMPVVGKQPPDLAEYAKSLSDPSVMHRETMAKLFDRYDGGRFEKHENMSLKSAHAMLRAGADMNEIDMDRNPITGHYLEPEKPPFPVSRREAWRSVMSRDYLFAARAFHGKCLFFDSGASAHVDSIVAIADCLCESSAMPVTVMSDCSRLLRDVTERLDFYHYAHHVPVSEAYMAMPRIFQSFVLVGGTGARPPLSRAKGRVWHYVMDRGDVSGAEEKAYVVVADAFETCIKAQNATKRLAYYVPPLITGLSSAEKTVNIGFHPDTARLVTSIKKPAVVPPELAHTCRVYVSCVSEEGVERCMASGGVAVARIHRLVDDGVNGILSGGETKVQVDAAVVRAIGCHKEELGEEAKKTRLLFGEATFKWLWKGMLSRSDPLSTGNPRDSAVLHERFLIITAALRYRQILRQRATGINRRAVLFVDNRPDPATALAVLITLTNLRAGWGVVGFVTGESRGFYEGFLGHLGPDTVFADMPGYKKRSFFIEQYNARMKRVDTWLTVAEHADTVLTVQNDGLLVRGGLEGHPCNAYEYCGAPWKPAPYLEEATRGNLVGNGGFSFRSVPAMVKTCRDHYRETEAVYRMSPLMSEAEDVFFARRVEACPVNHAMTFSIEQTSNMDAMGYHRFWMYHPVDFAVRFFEKALQETAAAVPSTKRVDPAAAARPLRRRVPPGAANIL